MARCAFPLILAKVTYTTGFIWSGKLTDYFVCRLFIPFLSLIPYSIFTLIFCLPHFHFITILFIDINKSTTTISGYLNKKFVALYQQCLQSEIM